MKRFGKIALLAVIFLIVGGFFAWIPLGSDPGTSSYHGQKAICYELQQAGTSHAIYEPSKTSKNGLPIPYTTYTGSCPPSSPSSFAAFMIDFISGGLLGLVTVKVVLNRRKK
jgi:hypothetical protein